MRTCSVDDCDRRHDNNGYCGMHAARVRRHGDPGFVKFANGVGAPVDRFSRKVAKSDGCWLWIGGQNHGYGIFWDGEKLVRAHRWSYEHHVGAIPEGLDLDHLCRNPSCVRPDHLEPVTRAENTRRGARWGDPIVSEVSA